MNSCFTGLDFFFCKIMTSRESLRRSNKSFSKTHNLFRKCEVFGCVVRHYFQLFAETIMHDWNIKLVHFRRFPHKQWASGFLCHTMTYTLWLKMQQTRAAPGPGSPAWPPHISMETKQQDLQEGINYVTQRAASCFTTVNDMDGSHPKNGNKAKSQLPWIKTNKKDIFPPTLKSFMYFKVILNWI